MAEKKKTAASKSAPRNAAKSKGSKQTQQSLFDTKNQKMRRTVDESSAYYLVIPYVLSFLGLFLLICFLFPTETQKLGDFTKLLAGVFSYGAWGIPFFILVEAVFWKADASRHRVKTKTVFASICVLFLSVAAQLMNRTEGAVNTFKSFYESGKVLESGGIVGGYLGEWLYGIAGWGAGIITVAALIIFGFAMFNITPIDAVVFFHHRIMAALYDRREFRKLAKPCPVGGDGELVAEEPVEKRHFRDPKFKTDDRKVIIPEGKKFNVDIPVETPADKRKGFLSSIKDAIADEPKEETKTIKPEPENESDIQPQPVKPDGGLFEQVKKEENATANSPINLADIFTDDAMIAAAGMAAQKDVLLDKSAAPTAVGVKELCETEGAEADDESEIEVKSGEVKISPKPTKKETYQFPPASFLKSDPNPMTFSITDELRTTSIKLVETLSNFGVRTKIMNISCGPTVTRYELQPEIGVRVRSIQNLSDDIALHLAASGVRIEAPIPGKDAVGIEVPNKTVSIVYLRDLIESKIFAEQKSRLSVCLGMDVAGSPVLMDMAKMPHLLIAGATGMGKSVCINSFIVSVLYKARPDEVKMILIDPKKVELSIYNGIPHLLVPVVSDPKKAAGSLAWAVSEMERRFVLIEEVGVREIKAYNEITKNDPDKEFLPQVVIIIDELADLMMTAREEVETSICRLAQKARAAGMHLVIGTQRPSVDVITGLIKANVPSRIAFTVASQVDSRTIIDIAGAEKLLGRGDMLFAPVGCMKPMRVQGAFVSENEVEAITEFLKKQVTAEYDADIIDSIEREAARCGEKKKGKAASSEDADFGEDLDSDEMILPAIGVAVEGGQISTSLLQRRLSLGYARAARIVDKLELMGIVGPYEGSKPRKVLITKEEYFEMKLRSDEKG